ncbi:hypothetical protein TWF281_001450 [Arthrobotrys megalospora]
MNAGEVRPVKIWAASSGLAACRFKINTISYAVYAGAEQKPFCLHRAIIAQNSEYFDNIFSSPDEKNTSAIYLKEITSYSFNIIATWLYGRTNQLSLLFCSRIRTVALYKSANFLGIHKLKGDILEMIKRLLDRELKEAHKEPMEKEHYILMEEICAYSQPSDRPLLKECLILALESSSLEPTSALEFYRDREPSEILLAILEELLQAQGTSRSEDLFSENESDA